MNLKKIFCTVLSVLLMLNLFVSFSYAEKLPYDDPEKNSLWIIFGYPDTFDRYLKKDIYYARLDSVEKWKEIKEQIEWDEKGRIAYKKDSVRLLDKYFSSVNIDESIIVGDFNGNGTVDVGDARIALRLAVGLDEPTKELTLEKVDVSVNDVIDIEDARILLRIAVRLEYPISYVDIHGLYGSGKTDNTTQNSISDNEI